MSTSARHRRRTWLLQQSVLLTLALVFIQFGHVYAASPSACLIGTDPAVAGDVAAITSVRAAIDAACPCSAYDGSKGKTDKEYGTCADAVIAAATKAGRLRKQCQNTVEGYYDQSICGQDPKLHSVVCVTTDTKKNEVSCEVVATTKKDGVTPTNACVSKAGKDTEVACTASHATWTNCIDAADTNGDLVIGVGPKGTDSGSCNCLSGFKDCNGQAGDGCEVAVTADPKNCGGCGTQCSNVANAAPGCVNAACTIDYCQAGYLNLDGIGSNGCEYSCTPTSAVDVCDGVDNDCDGIKDNVTGKAAGSSCTVQTDIHNCGTVGNDCLSGAVHANWSCQAGSCVFQGCQAGYFDLNSDQKCEYACTFTSSQELCNGIDDNCNGLVDESVVPPSPTQVCGVSPTATSPECTSGVNVACTNGTWTCKFLEENVCTGATCAATAEICDDVDNNCNGLLNENVPNYGAACASDDGLPPPGDGACRTTGTFVCDGKDALKCSAVKDLSKAGPELCDGLDNDCDGVIDETFNAKGANATFFVKPAVTKIGSSLWIDSYEASRPNATTIIAGSGNGYFTTAPAGETLDKTPACSVPGKIPWSNITPLEAEQVCTAKGGHLCSTTELQTACETNPPSTTACEWGYYPRGTACTTPASPVSLSSAKWCNLASTYDFNPAVAGDQDGLLVSGSAALKNCWADWSSLLGNTTATNKIFDVTGNLREISKTATNTYTLVGGSFLTQVEDGAACEFSTFVVDQNFELFDTGFRCCYNADPTQ